MNKWVTLLSIGSLMYAPIVVEASQSQSDYRSKDWIEYHQPTDVENPLEVSIDKGLVVELIVQCRQASGKLLSGIMTYSKPDQKYCSSKHECFDAFEPAHYDTCR